MVISLKACTRITSMPLLMANNKTKADQKLKIEIFQKKQE